VYRLQALRRRQFELETILGEIAALGPTPVMFIRVYGSAREIEIEEQVLEIEKSLRLEYSGVLKDIGAAEAELVAEARERGGVNAS
jgi:hypothetical protein